MELNSHEATLLDAFRRLPEDTAHELSALVQRLAAQSSTTKIDWSDAWSEQDLREFAAHSVARFEAEEKG